MAKIPTQWFNPNRRGSLLTISNLLFVTNTGKFIVDNKAAHNQIVTTPAQLSGSTATAWAQV